jgi:hypothetical protein
MPHKRPLSYCCVAAMHYTTEHCVKVCRAQTVADCGSVGSGEGEDEETDDSTVECVVSQDGDACECVRGNGGDCADTESSDSQLACEGFTFDLETNVR